jgi:dienelactone hydrolase
MDSSPSLLVIPQHGLVDDVISVHVTGLPPHCDVTLAAVLDESGKVFVSYAHYVADWRGTVNVDTDGSNGGTYTGVEPQGLLWSLTPADGQMKGLRLIKQNVATPFVVDLYALDGHVIITSQSQIATANRVYANCRMYRYYMGTGVRAVPVRNGALRGMLFLPAGDGPFPAVIDMFGTAGGLIQFRSALLASRGVMSLALAYFDYEDLPVNMDLNMEYFEEAVDWLYGHPLVLKDSGGIGVIGVSKGASLAMQVATMSDKVKAVVSINGAAIHHTGKHTYKGVDQPVFGPTADQLLEGFLQTEEGCEFGEVYSPTPDKLHAVIPIERSKSAKFLFVIGEDDPSNVYSNVTVLLDRLKQHGLSNYRLLSYPRAGHLIEPPYTPHCRVAYSKLIGAPTVFGGQCKPHAVAQEHAWAQLLSFIQHELNPKSSSQQRCKSQTNSKL